MKQFLKAILLLIALLAAFNLTRAKQPENLTRGNGWSNPGYKYNFTDTTRLAGVLWFDTLLVDSIWFTTDTLYIATEAGTIKIPKVPGENGNPILANITVDDTTRWALIGVTTQQLIDTSNAVEQRANNFTIAQKQQYSTPYLSDLDTFNVSQNTVVFVGETGKSYYWSGVSWTEITSDLSVTNDRVSFTNSTIEEVTDFSDIKQWEFNSSNVVYAPGATYTPSFPVQVIDYNKNKIVYLVDKRSQLTYNNDQDTIPHNVSAISDGILIQNFDQTFDTSFAFAKTGTQAINYGLTTDGNKFYVDYMLLNSTIEVGGVEYSSTPNGLGEAWIAVFDSTYNGDTAFVIMTSTVLHAIPQNITYDPYSECFYMLWRTAGNSSTITFVSSDGNNLTYVTPAVGKFAGIVKYDKNWKAINYIAYETDNTSLFKTYGIVADKDYIYAGYQWSGGLTIPSYGFMDAGAYYQSFITKLDKSLNLQFLRVIKSSETTTIRNIQVDEFGDITANGNFTGTAPIEAQSLDSSFVQNSNVFGDLDGFFIRYDKTGKLLQLSTVGGTGKDLIVGKLDFKDYTALGICSNSQTIYTSSDSTTRPTTEYEPGILFLNKYTNKIIDTAWIKIHGSAGDNSNLSEIFKTDLNDYIYGYWNSDDIGDSAVVGDSIYPQLVSSRMASTFKFGVESAVKGVSLNNSVAFVGDYYNENYVEYRDSALKYMNPKSDFQGNEIPSANWVLENAGGNPVVENITADDTTRWANNGINALIEDESPQLSANLDANGNDISIDAGNYFNIGNMSIYDDGDYFNFNSTGRNLNFNTNGLYIYMERIKLSGIQLQSGAGNKTISGVQHIYDNTSDDSIRISSYIYPTKGFIWNDDTTKSISLDGDILTLSVNNENISIDKDIVSILDTVITLSSTQIDNLGTTPVEIFPASGSGKLYDILTVSAYYDYVSAAYTASGGTLEIDNGFTKHTTSAAQIVSYTTDRVFQFAKSAFEGNSSTYNNQAVNLTFSDDFASGDGNVKLYVTYRIVTL